MLITKSRCIGGDVYLVEGASIAGRTGPWKLRIVPFPVTAWIPAQDGNGVEEVLIDPARHDVSRKFWIRAKAPEAAERARIEIGLTLAARAED